MPARRWYLAIFLFVLAPIGAAVVVGVLLLFGVAPQLVFAPGRAVMSLLAAPGMHVPKAVGVVSTVGMWWLLIVAAGVAWDRRSRAG
jgi:hypothetical protein